MRLSNISAALSTIAVHAAAYSAQVDVDTRSLDEIYEAARSEEGTLQVFWGGDAGSQGDSVRKAWAAAYPDVKLNLTVDLSKYHDNRIDRAHLQGLHVADVAVLQTLHDFRRWKSEGKLLNYKPANFEDIINGEKDADGAWYAEAISMVTSTLSAVAYANRCLLRRVRHIRLRHQQDQCFGRPNVICFDSREEVQEQAYPHLPQR